MNVIRVLLPIAVLAAGLAAGNYLITTGPKAERQRPAPAIPAVEVMTVKPQDYRVTVRTRGTVSPRTQSTLIPEVAGRITFVAPNFRNGGFFETGDLLLRIDPLDYEDAVTVARAELAERRLGLAEELARAEQARIDWKRLGSGEPPNALVLRQPQLASARAAVAAAEARLRQAEIDLARTRIVAPYAGRVLNKQADIGQYVSSGTALASIYAVDYVEVRLPLTDDQLAFVELPELYRGESLTETKPAPAVTVTARVADQVHRWHGKVVRTEGAIDTQSRQVFVVAQVDDPYARQGDRPPLKVGRFVEAEIEGRLLKGVFVVPRRAVRVGDQVWLVSHDRKLERHRLSVVWRETDHIVVQQGLETGDQLSLTPLPQLADGTEVQIAGGERQRRMTAEAPAAPKDHGG